ncbi:MAG: tyrosine-type recombinase/integrase [Massilibacteroides sp.]|nr:tyrosine-type recombinase/integrase [Massilibacteroides sp.]
MRINNEDTAFRQIPSALEEIHSAVRPAYSSLYYVLIHCLLLCSLLLSLHASKSYQDGSMTVKTNSSYFSHYFNILYDDLFYDVLSARFLFASGVRPEEYLNLTIGNIDLATSTLNFTQAKGGLYTTRAIDSELAETVRELWRLYGAPANYYGSYSTMENYIKRTIASKFTVTNRLKALYPFRYSCCADLIRQEFTQSEIEEFFNHNNPANTMFYIQQGTNINLQLSTL